MDATVHWDASADPDGDLVGYNVYHGYLDPFGVVYWIEFFTVLAPTLQKSFTGLDDFKTHYFAVSAFDEVPNESQLSSVVSKRVPHRFRLK
jgi:hypothetical protein